MKELLDLVERVVEACTGGATASPRLVPLEEAPPDPYHTRVPPERLSAFAGRFTVPPPPLGLPAESAVAFEAEDGHLVGVFEQGGTSALYVQPDGTLRQEDSRDQLFAIRDERGALAGLADADEIARGALGAAGEGQHDRARAILASAGDDGTAPILAARAVTTLLAGEREGAARRAREAASRLPPPAVERAINRAGYLYLQRDRAELARRVFELNTEVFPDASNTWDSLGEAYATLGRTEDAVRAYERSLALDPGNAGARAALEKLRAKR
jgi:tetratricopeptide (TPR) repeat protein